MESRNLQLAGTWDRIRDGFFADGDAARVLSGRTGLVDDIVRSGFDEILAPAYPSGLALLAVGGYGRRELFPHSDVDLLILGEKESIDKGLQTKEQKEALSAFLMKMWDSGLRLSHSVRTVPECCELHEQNIELNVSLLDQRFLTGDANLNAELQSRLPKFLRAQSQELAKHLTKLTRTRHAKYQDTIYHMEPNIKDTPGGLRDLHMVWWLHRLQQSIPFEERSVELAPARDFLHSLRCFLHYRVGRDANALGFELQDEIAQQPFVPEKNPAEWMREYFRHARQIHLTADRAIETAEGPGGNLFSQFREWRSRLSNADFTVSRERVYLKSPQQLESEPELVLRLFRFVARHGLRLALDTERRIAAAMPSIAAHYSTSRALWPSITEILTLPNAAMALESMNETGVLSAVFPEWRRIECLVVRDFYHRYTVDEHTLVAMRTLSDLRGATDPSLQRFTSLLEEVDHPATLMFALLFHDIGKGGGEGKHVEASRPLLESALTRIQAPRNIFHDVWELIEQHLTLSATMTGRDLDDPATALELAERVGTVEQLRNLTLLTFADISAVNPTAMTPWRMDQLWRVYLCAHRELTRELDAARIEAPAVRSPELAAFVAGFPKRYMRTHSEEEMQSHFELRKRSESIGAAIEIRRLNGVYAAEVVTKDRPGLFAAIAGALSSFGMNIVKAEAFANRAGEILDTFTFSDPGRTLELNPSEVDRLRLTIERVLLGRADVKELLRTRPIPAPPSKHSRIRPAISFDSDASKSSTLVEIVAEDRPGLLYDLARTVSGADCNIEVVLIDTEAHKAVDVFYLTCQGKKLTPEKQAELQQALASVCRP